MASEKTKMLYASGNGKVGNTAQVNDLREIFEITFHPFQVFRMRNASRFQIFFGLFLLREQPNRC